MKTNGSGINQRWKMTNVKYLRTLQSKQIKEIEHRRLDIVVIDKEKRECKIIDLAVPGDQNIKVKELEEITKYQELRLQVQKLEDVKATVIPIVVGALGTTSEKVGNHLKTIVIGSSEYSSNVFSSLEVYEQLLLTYIRIS